ncbi:beta-lactamase superfamily domain-containing protein [Crucibulum laeve]|uniref:Beta-lactamase superfamily domain-containing protein n=1 Tax=Crucibulum laeve TaxID=68775 RepID=A0A5C3M062_9AGAR|nr:beta-lactamase superfamily domain-containing protein [Crucibulum laeve]
MTLADSVSAILHSPLSRARPFETFVEPVKTVACEFGLYNTEEEEGRGSICTTWLGHAGFLLQLPRSTKEERPTRIIFDPIFAERASPSAWFGPRRYLPTPCKVNELPSVDYIVISHNHYDHLDIECLKQIHRQCPEVQFLVALGVKSFLMEELTAQELQIHELDWWETVSFPMALRSKVEFVCTPAQHNSGRGITDQRKTLWASWVVRQFLASQPETPSASIYFAGDTGYSTSSGPCPAFKEIGNKYGPFDLAMIPIWRGASLSILGRLGFRLTPGATETLLSTLHASPSDAVELAEDVKAKHSIAMHFGTFCGSDDEAREPLVLLAEALLKKGKKWTKKAPCKEGDFGVINVGETVFIPTTPRS